jgi:hypothetical protein
MSGRKNVLLPFYAVGVVADGAIVSGDMSANIVSPVTVAQYFDNIGFQIAWASADAIGTIAIEGSIDYQERGPLGVPSGTFYALTFDPILNQPNSNNGGYLVNVNQFPFTAYRVTYTRSSGSGAMTVYWTGKMI